MRLANTASCIVPRVHSGRKLWAVPFRCPFQVLYLEWSWTNTLCRWGHSTTAGPCLLHEAAPDRIAWASPRRIPGTGPGRCPRTEGHDCWWRTREISDNFIPGVSATPRAAALTAPGTDPLWELGTGKMTTPMMASATVFVRACSGGAVFGIKLLLISWRQKFWHLFQRTGVNNDIKSVYLKKNILKNSSVSYLSLDL